MSKNAQIQKDEKDGNLSRRSFLRKLWISLGAIAAFEYLFAGFEILVGNRAKENRNKNKLIQAGKIDDFQPNSVVLFRNGMFYLVRFPDGGFIAVSTKCTHLGCAVSWNNENNEFICPCHSSIFNVKGDVVKPPASRALDLFPVKIENGIVKVNAGKPLKRKNFSESQIVYAES